MTRRHPRMCLLGVWMTTHNIKGFKTAKKGAWLGIFQPKWQNYKIVIFPAGNIGSIPNFDTVIEPHSWLRGWSRITKFIFKMADGCRIAEYWKRYGRLEAEHVNQFWWNLVHNSKLGPQWQSRDQILQFLKFKMADGRHVWKYWKCHNSPTNDWDPTWVVTSHHVPDMSPTIWLPWQRPLPSIEHSAVMGVWRPNAWTNFDEIWHTTAN